MLSLDRMALLTKVVTRLCQRYPNSKARGLALAMIKDLADKGDVLAKAMIKSMLSHISAESTAKVILNALFNLLPH